MQCCVTFIDYGVSAGALVNHIALHFNGKELIWKVQCLFDLCAVKSV